MPAPSNLTREEAAARAALLSDVHYEIELDLRGDGGEVFASTTTVRFRCARQGAGTFLDLLGRAVETLEVNGERRTTEGFDGARLPLDGLHADNVVRVVARCAYSHLGVGMSRFTDPVDGRVYLHTQFEPFDAHRVFACFDQPDLKAVFSFSVLAPEDWVVVSNSAPAGEPVAARGGGRSWRFAPTRPVSPYITAIVAGPYHAVHDRHGGIELGLYCRQSLARYLDPAELFTVTKQGFDWFERTFDYPYPFGKYDQLFVPEYKSGAMENPGCVTFAEQFVYRSRVTEAERADRAEAILHEMAHMWFGDLVTMRWWDDLWLNESFATFISIQARVAATRFTNGWVTFAQITKAWAYEQDQLPSTHPVAADIPDAHAVMTNFDGITYAKGAAVIRQLVAWVGEAAFVKGIRDYFQAHEYGNTELGDFLAALEAASGRDLTAWSDAWLQSAGVNTLRARVRSAHGQLQDVSVVQSAPAAWPVLRPHRVTVGLYDEEPDGLVLRGRTEMDVTGSTTTVPDVAGSPVPALVLVNDTDLAYAKVRLDDASLATMRRRLGAIPDPLARVVAWNIAWDMTRDAELPAREFARLVLEHGAGEDDVAVLEHLLTRARAAVDRFGDPANWRAGRAALADFAHDGLRQAEAGSERQLIWATGLIGLAEREDQLALLRGLLDGSAGFDGLVVDTELRWQLVKALAAAGRSEDLIDAELERDPTDAGQRHAAGARASRPSPEAKAAAWEAVQDPAMPRSMLLSIARGFHQPGQAELLEPYAARYFEVLGVVEQERELEFAITFARAAYPHTVVTDQVVDAAERLLQSGTLSPPIRRVLSEEQDRTRRALRARATDAQP